MKSFTLFSGLLAAAATASAAEQVDSGITWSDNQGDIKAADALVPRNLMFAPARAAASAGSTPTLASLLNRTKVSLPPLDFEFNALEPYISGQINEIHYTKHHQTYVNNYNSFTEQYAEALSKNDTIAQLHLLPLINFNAGGYINHNLFWKNLSPKNVSGGKPPANDTKLAAAIKENWGSLDKLINVTNTKLAGIQGSGWAWIVKNKDTGEVEVITTSNQDVVPADKVPLVGIDAWEHAYYLQYKNVKADYFSAIWNVINWKEAAKRYDA